MNVYLVRLYKKDRLISMICSFTILSLFLLPLTGYKGEFLWSKICIFNLGLFCACLAAIVLMYVTKYEHLQLEFPVLLFPISVLIIFIISSSLLVSVNPYKSVSQIIILGGNIVLYFILIFFINDKNRLEGIFLYLFPASIIVSIYGILQYFEVVPVPREFFGQKDPGSTFFRTNQAAQFLVSVLPYFMVRSFLENFYFSFKKDTEAKKGIYKRQRLYKKLIWTTGTGIILYYFFIIKARGSLIGLCIAWITMFVIFLLRGYKQKIAAPPAFKINSILIKSFAALMAVFLFYFLFNTKDLFNLKDSPVIFRMLAWKSSLNMIKDNLWVGVGAGNFETVFPLYQVPELEIIKLKEANRIIYAHNDFLHIMAEYGITGCMIFIWIGCYIFKISKRWINNAKDVSELMRCLAIAGGIIGTLVHACFSYNLQFPVPVACIVFFISVLETNGRPNEGRRIGKHKITLVICLLALCSIFSLYSVIYAARRTVSEITLADGTHVRKRLSAKKSIEIINRSIDLYPYNDIAYFEKGLAYKGLERWEPAIENFKKSIELYPYNGKAYRQIGLIYIKMGRYNDAEKIFHKALDITPGLKKVIESDMKKIR